MEESHMTADLVELDYMPGSIAMPGLVLFTKRYVHDLSVSLGLTDWEIISFLHGKAVGGLEAVCAMRDGLARRPPGGADSGPQWEAVMEVLNGISYLLHNGRTHDGREIKFV
jgi:hypothetical protein